MKRAVASWLLLPLAGVIVVLVLLSDPAGNAAPSDDRAYFFHFLITTGVAFLAFLSAFLVGLVAADIRDSRALLLFLALVSIGGFLTLHGLGTPEVLIPIDDYVEENGLGLYQVAGVLSLFVGAFFFALSARSWGAAGRRLFGDRVTTWMGVVTIAFLVFDVGGLVFHQTLDQLPITRPPSIWIFAVPTIVLFAWSALRYAREYALARLPMQWALVMGLTFLVAAAFAQAASPPWTWSWWEYHVLMLLGFLAILGGILFEFSRRRSLRTIMEGLVRLRGLVESELEYSDTVSSLAAATEARDRETHGHTTRVAEIAVRIGHELGLSTERLRVLARAGLLHDIGKLGIPDSILLKPAPLDEAEWEIMRRHPELGHDIVMRAGSLERESRLVRMHHEWLDGTGYNAHLGADEISLDARILSVADVYDSLVSDRPYRRGYPPDKAIDILRSEAGAHLDPTVVAAWTRIYAAYVSPAPAGTPAAASPRPVSGATPP